MSTFELNTISHKIQLNMVVTLSNASSPHSKTSILCRQAWLMPISWGLSHLPDMSTQELDTKSI